MHEAFREYVETLHPSFERLPFVLNFTAVEK